MKEPLDEAHVAATNVEVQVVRIGSKQMTLAIFKQLEEGTLLDDSGELVAAPWGWVNSAADGGCRWFVFSVDGKLYRDCVAMTRNLVIQPEMTPGPGEKPTGKWLVVDGSTSFGKRVRKKFGSRPDAVTYRSNRLNSLTAMEQTKQLFIAI